MPFVFDPHNKMNPGKICTPLESTEPLVKVSGQKRGEFDRQIPIEVRTSFEPVMSCNGNGLCFNYDTTSPMCPSFKITGDRRHSPKGRAGMVREWLRLLSNQNIDVNALGNNLAIQFDLAALQTLTPAQLAKKVCIVQDPFTSFYDAQVVESLVLLITKLGYEPVLLPFMPNGKPQHVKGFLKEFAKTAKNAADFLNQLDDLDLPLIGVDPSMVLCYRDEYTKVLGKARGEFKVQLVHEWLLELELPKIGEGKEYGKTQNYALFGHCSEKTALPISEKQWQSIFQKVGLNLSAVSVAYSHGC